MKLSQSLLLAAAGSLVAAQAHQHGHRHLHNVHKRDTIVETVAEVAYVYQLGDEVVAANDACKGIKEGKYQWGEGAAPDGVCGAVGTETSFKTVTPTSTPTPAAVFFEKTSTTKTSTTPTTTSTPPPPPPPPTTTSTSTSTSATPSASPSSVAPAPGTQSGGVTIFNNVGQTLYLWTTTNVPLPMVTLPHGQSYAESWKLNPDQGGISIKVSTTPTESDVLQFEYTLVSDVIWWDVSLINMLLTSLFDQLGFQVTSNDETCRKVLCPAGKVNCSDAYLYPTDDQATSACTANTNMVLNLGPA
jgi:hypothetical protein